MNQIEWVYNQLQLLSEGTLIQIIDELGLEIQENEYKKMTTDIYNKAKAGANLSPKQKRVLVNIIGQPR
jgi:hypothetical protein